MTIGCARVRSSPFSRATAFIASSFVCMADHIYCLIFRSAAVIIVNINTRLARPLMRPTSLLKLFSAFSAAGDNAFVVGASAWADFCAPATCFCKSAAFSFAAFNLRSVSLIFRLLYLIYLQQRQILFVKQIHFFLVRE